MLNQETLEKYDSEKMYKIYDDWPNLAKQAYDSDLEPASIENIDHIVFAGMGGSGAIGLIFASILSKTNIHVSIVNGYNLPKTVDENTLVVCTSVSGNTEETLSVLNYANNIKCKKIVFSSGGKIEKYCLKHHINFRKINEIHSPRTSFAKYLFSMIKILNPILKINDSDIINVIQELEKLKNKISSKNLVEDNPAIKLAKWIKGIPIIYYPSGLNSVATRFKNSLQENVKTHAISENIIEMCHNGIVSWEKSSNVQPILIHGVEDHPKTEERWNIVKQYFNEKEIAYEEILSVRGPILSKVVNLIYLLDYASIYLAVISGIDPSPVESIDYIKNKM